MNTYAKLARLPCARKLFSAEVTEASAAARAREILAGITPPEPDFPGGPGIVTSAGGYRYFCNAFVLIRLLRSHGCDLPIEVWYSGRAEMSEEMSGLLSGYDVTTVDADNVCRALGIRRLKGWEVKPLSMAFSRFSDVLFLDADNCPVRDPSYLFKTAAYEETGLVAWPDRPGPDGTATIRSILGLPWKRERDFESGQFLISKRRLWRELVLALWMNLHSGLFYRYIYGDKDTYRFACHLAGTGFSMPDHPLVELRCKGLESRKFLSVMCQHDFSGERVFQHRSFPKWCMLAENPRVPGFLHEAECIGFLKELRQLWDGRVTPFEGDRKRPLLGKGSLILETSLQGNGRSGHPPGRHPGAAAHRSPGRPPLGQDQEGRPNPERSVAAEPLIALNTERVVTFSPRGWIEDNLADDFVFWDLEEDGDGPELKLTDGDGETVAALRREKSSRRWHGKWVAKHHPLYGEALSLSPVELVCPGSRDPRSVEPGVPPGEIGGGRTLNVINTLPGLGDAVVSIYACAGAARQGFDVTFFTKHHNWFRRVRHPGLRIASIEECDRLCATDLNDRYRLHLSFARSRAFWYSSVIDHRLLPSRPDAIDRDDVAKVLPFEDYAVLAPFAAKSVREWPPIHWARLAHLLDRRGFNVVVLTEKSRADEAAAIFDRTTAFWIIERDVTRIVDLLLSARVLVGNDSGLAHVGGLLRIPTVAVHAQLPAELLWDMTEVQAVRPEGVDCSPCRWETKNGYSEVCEDGCSALFSVSAEAVFQRVLALLDQ